MKFESRLEELFYFLTLLTDLMKSDYKAYDEIKETIKEIKKELGMTEK